MRRSFTAAVIAAMVLCLWGAAHAMFSTDREYIVGYQPGITWQDTVSEAAGWGNSFHIATIDSRAEQRYVQSLIGGAWRAFWVEEYEASSQPSGWISGAPHGLHHWGRWGWDEYFGRGPQVQAVALRKSGSKNGYYDYGREDWKESQWNWQNWKWRGWEWNDKDPNNISGLVVERSDIQPAAAPVPPAMWLLGSGMALVAGMRFSEQRQREAGSRLEG